MAAGSMSRRCWNAESRRQWPASGRGARAPTAPTVTAVVKVNDLTPLLPLLFASRTVTEDRGRVKRAAAAPAALSRGAHDRRHLRRESRSAPTSKPGEGEKGLQAHS